MKLLSISSAEKIRTETCLVGSETKIIPKELYYGFMRYTVREHILYLIRNVYMMLNIQKKEKVLDVVRIMKMENVERE